MRALVQRVSEARVMVDGRVTGEIDAGALILICAVEGDSEAEAELLAGKIAKLRIFRDEDDRMNRSILDAGCGALVVSQFTLYGDATKGRRPTWLSAARPEHAEPLVERVVEALRTRGLEVATGRFREDMVVDIRNQGPATLMLEV